MKIPLILLTTGLALAILSVSSRGQTPAAPGAAAASATDLSQYATPDALWLHIQDIKKGPKTRPANLQEYRATATAICTQLNDAATEFVKRYPQDIRKWDARFLQIQAQASLGRLTGRGDTEATAMQFQDLANQTDAPGSVRGDARYQLMALALQKYATGDRLVTADTIVAQLKQFTLDFPSYPSLDVLKYKIAQGMRPADSAVSDSLMKELANSGQGRIADMARKQLETKEKLKAPLDLHFTAVDGAQVDLSTMRGKVVLLDFWATWCGPCKAEVPNVVAAYKKLHDKGFEVVGISLDQDRDAVLKYTAANGMTWPQYFDGKGWDNTISAGYGINSIPAMWLLDKKGIVVTTNGREDLAGQVEKLLAE
jgi:thiol-disulfide isomerase/thioredoxin